MPRVAGTVALFLLCACTPLPNVASPREAPAVAPSEPNLPDNLILMIGDGMGPAQVTAYRLFKDDPRTPRIDLLRLDRLLVGAVETSPKEQPWVVVDSAAAATAYATGVDTGNGAIGLDAEGRPLETLFERARKAGKSTGVVVTSQLTHATPAAFLAHVATRHQRHEIADQLLDNRVDGVPLADILLGGGREDLEREDRNLVAEFSEAGYQVVYDRRGLARAGSTPRVLGLFAAGGMPREWDRPQTIPSLAEMTTFALNGLKDRESGFLLLVEGSQIDWAGHDNDVASLVSEMESFDAAISVALNFARQSDDTLVVITADHETGGLSLGTQTLGFGSGAAYVWDARPLRGLKGTPPAIVADFEAGRERLSTVADRYLPFELTSGERQLLEAAGRGEPAEKALAAILDARTGTGWSTGGHTAVDVPLYAYGPGSDRFKGVWTNEGVGQLLRQLLLDREPKASVHEP